MFPSAPVIKTLTGSPVRNVDSLDGWAGAAPDWSSDQTRDPAPGCHWSGERRTSQVVMSPTKFGLIFKFR